MDLNHPDISNLIQQARNGNAAALGELLEHHRPYLRGLAKRQLVGKLGTRVDASDVAQQTCISVQRQIANLTNNNPQEFLAWLSRLHQCNIKNAIRDNVGTKKRDVNREQHLNEFWTAGVASSASGPSKRMMREENADQLMQALAHIPADQAQAVKMRHLDGLSLALISEATQRSESAVVGLIYRGLRSLRQHLDSLES